ncbi:MAG: HAMP domain-containing histidine kinase [Clostridiales bacterium]|nr:HAMP domain-containing histidine kinase [Clostridiales bacterium]
MATKLKNLTKRQQEILLGIGWILVSMMATYSRIFFQYYFDERVRYYWSLRGRRFYEYAWMILAGLAVILGSITIFRTVSYLKKYYPSRKMKICRIDRIKTELLVFVCIFSGWKWILAFRVVVVVWGRYLLNTVHDTLLFSLLLLAVLVLFYGSLLLLLRQWAGGILKETSVICKEIRNYRERTPLEKKLQNRIKIPVILEGILTLGLLFAGVQLFNYWGSDILTMIPVILGILSFLLFMKTVFSNRTNREMGYLLEQIRAVSEGEDTEADRQIPENSLLYEASSRLKKIDESMRKSVEKQVQAERLKIDLITNVSHDLKTPLTSMVGYTDLLKQEELGEEAKDYVEIISMKQEQLKNMIQDLFELSKATSGADQLVMETLNMRKLLEQTMGDMADRIESSDRTIRTRFPEEPLLFIGDNGKMYRVVQNLLENALKYSLADTRIYLSAEKQGGKVQMEMKNIAAYEMDFQPDEIMERFVRGDTSRTTEGHGLGLAIASSFVRNMGGTLEIDIDGDLFKVTMQFPCVSEMSGDEVKR